MLSAMEGPPFVKALRLISPEQAQKLMRRLSHQDDNPHYDYMV